MKFKKTKGSYAIWGLYTICIWILASVGIMEICLQKKMTDTFVMISIVLALICMSLSYFGFRTLIDRFYDYVYFNKKSAGIFEKIAVSIILFIGVGYRLFLTTNSATLSILSYYDMAKIGATVSLPPDLSSLEILYIHILSMIFTFFGNKLLVGIIFQCILFTLGSAFVYMGVKIICSKTPAVVLLLFVNFSPEFISDSINCTPDMLYYFAFGITLWGLALYIKRRSEDDIFNARDMLCVIFPGIALGIITYLDLASFTLVCLFVFAAFVVKEESRTINGKIAFQFAVCGISMLLSFIFCIVTQSIFNDFDFGGTLKSWMYYNIQAAEQIRFVGNAFSNMASSNPIFYILIFSLLIWFSFTFFMDKKHEKLTAWFCIACLVLLFGYLNLSVYYEIILYIMIFTLAGCGLQGVYVELDDLADVTYDNIPVDIAKAIEEGKPTYNTTLLSENAPAKPVLQTPVIQSQNVPQPAVSKPEVPKSITPKPVIINTEAPKPVTPAPQKVDLSKIESSKPEASKAEPVKTEPTKPIQYIPNPLPTPKPHVKKTMGYAFEPLHKDMKYDIHVADNDDYDLKV